MWEEGQALYWTYFLEFKNLCCEVNLEKLKYILLNSWHYLLNSEILKKNQTIAHTEWCKESLIHPFVCRPGSSPFSSTPIPFLVCASLRQFPICNFNVLLLLVLSTLWSFKIIFTPHFWVIELEMARHQFSHFSNSIHDTKELDSILRGQFHASLTSKSIWKEILAKREHTANFTPPINLFMVVLF